MRRPSLLLFAALAAAPVLAQTSATPLPQAHIPLPVILEMRALESRFDQALSQDCAPERCFSKGCVYREHATVDLPRSGSLPGLGSGEGPGSVPVQEYLTQARCEFTHEKSVSKRDVAALVKRLEQRLSRGWLQVSVDKQILAPVSESLRESPKPPEEAPPPAPPPPPEVKPAEPVVPQEWEAGVALRELWVSLLPHFSWMIALVLATLAAMTIIWALRRLGRESIEEKAMLAQLEAGPEKSVEPEAPPAAPDTPPSPEAAADGAFIADQQRLWTERIAHAELARDEGVVVELLRGWLTAGEFALLAKAIFLFGDRLSLAFSSDGELAPRKIEFAEYLRNLDEKALPSDAEFFRKLNHHAISSSLLAQADAEVYRSLREEFGASGVADLVESLPPRHGALLFAMAPLDAQHEVARILAAPLRIRIAEQLLVSTRMSREEMGQLFEVLNAARSGSPLPRIPAAGANVIADRGRAFDAAGALSVLLPRIDPEHRRELFANALERSSGTFPLWYEGILYPDMLHRVPEELKRDLLLEVDVRGLAGWSSVQPPQWQESFLNGLAPTMQNAVRAGMSFGSREDQLKMARRGHEELVTAMKRLVAGGKVSFPEIVA